MPACPEQPRRRGAPPGNRNRLTHGLYTRLAVERRAATARIVAATREISAGVAAAERQREGLNRAGLPKRKTSKIDVRIALVLFKYVAERLNAAAVPADYPFEPIPPRPGRKRASVVQSHSGEGAPVPVSPVDSL
jgi:hypothetical protein